MYILTGDEIGLVKLLDIDQIKDSKLSSNPAYKQPISASVSNRLKTESYVESSTINHPPVLLNDQITSHTRESQVSCISWNPTVSTKNLQSPSQSVEFDRSETESSLFIGRSNGLVEFYNFPDCFQSTLGCRKRFRLNDGVISCSPCFWSPSTTMENTSSNFCVCVTKNGHCLLVDWNEMEPCKEIVHLIFDANHVRTIPFHQKKIGRTPRSDNARSRNLQHEDSLPSEINICVWEAEHLLWVKSFFNLPGPITCSSMSEAVPSYMAFGGSNNIVKVIDLKTQKPHFTGKNCQTNSLGIEECIDVTSVTFLDQLNNTASSLAVGNGNGRLYLYDTRLCGKPVVDVQICDKTSSIVCIQAQSSLQYTKKAYSCEIHSKKENCFCFQDCQSLCFERKVVEDPLSSDTKLSQQSLAISDNHGTVYLYDIRAMSKKLNQKDEIPNFSFTKKRKTQPLPFQYKPNTIVYCESEKYPIHYETFLRHHLINTKGAITSLCWARLANSPYLVGASLGRFVNVWNTNKKNAGLPAIYLKNKLTACCFIDSSIPFTKNLQTNKDTVSDVELCQAASRASLSEDAFNETSNDYDSSHDSVDDSTEEDE
ncbi:uncharacterized protein LOC128882601 [Hylaeus volcanicus]|uniref:uncharacterized protein LOC128882601 n=1 Tax=Hylaeus volcanicus TaxID=313075 RepID=UPI0023B77949|nr:uncharacterized protein LOC128882601 [Hylaeus volcanicus]